MQKSRQNPAKPRKKRPSRYGGPAGPTVQTSRNDARNGMAGGPAFKRSRRRRATKEIAGKDPKSKGTDAAVATANTKAVLRKDPGLVESLRAVGSTRRTRGGIRKPTAMQASQLIRIPHSPNSLH